MAAKKGRWPVNVKLRERIAVLEKALIRACGTNGHTFHCGAARGLESECHCGWVEIKQLVKSLSQGKRSDAP